MLKMFKTSSPKKIFDYDCITLYASAANTVAIIIAIPNTTIKHYLSFFGTDIFNK